MHTHFNLKSGNKKLGLIPVSTTERASCPASCPLNDGSCYAISGYFISHHWKQVTNKTRGDNYGDFLAHVSALKPETFWRHNQAGDLAGTGETINFNKLKKLVEANRGKRGYTYTHKHKNTDNYKKIKYANDNGFTVNLSADSIEEADRLLALEIAPVVVTLPSTENYNHTITTPAGNLINICPATYNDKITCKDCQLCQVRNRSNIVGFPLH